MSDPAPITTITTTTATTTGDLLAQAEAARATGDLGAGLAAATRAWSALPEADTTLRRRGAGPGARRGRSWRL